MKKKRMLLWIPLTLLAVVVVLVLIFCGIYFTRFCTIAGIEKLSSYEDGYDLYSMEVKYSYDLDDLIDYGVTDDAGMFDAILDESLPFLPISFNTPSFGCSAFTMTDTDEQTHMGRNYDFRYDTSNMLVYCAPKDGYRSVAFAALDNVSANSPLSSMKQRVTTLVAPFVCLDGMNEKGVSIAVLTLDSEPVCQNTGKEKIFTTLAIRLVLDRAATTEEAVELLRGYDMYSAMGRDYHFYITDASGDGRIIEYDCESETREMVDTKTDVVTNFFALYADQVQPNQKNGIYGHGKERYDAMLEVFKSQQGAHTPDTAWDALMAAAQDPSGESLTSNTQWSIVYNNDDLTADITLRRHWGDVFHYDLKDNTVTQ